jgi:hypothetical protein
MNLPFFKKHYSVSCGLKNTSVTFFGICEQIFQLTTLGDVLDSQQNDPFLTQPSFYLSGIEQHHASADGGKIVIYLIVIKGGLLGQDGFQQFAQLSDIPLFIAKIIDKLTTVSSGLTLKNS